MTNEQREAQKAVQTEPRRYLRWPDEQGFAEPAFSVFSQGEGGLGIDVNGLVIVKPVRDWHALATARKPLSPSPKEIIEKLVGALEHYAKDYDYERKVSQWDGGAKAREALTAAQQWLKENG